MQRAGPRLGLLLADPAVAEGLAATEAQEDLLAALVGDRWAVVSLEKDDDALGQELVTKVNDLSSRGARRLVVAINGADGADQEARIKRLLLQLYLIHPEAYRSVLNVADHYGWPVLIRADAAPAWPHGSIPGVTAWLGLAAADVPSGRWGAVAGPAFWDGDNPAPGADLLLVPVPAQADPEAVMKRVRALA